MNQPERKPVRPLRGCLKKALIAGLVMAIPFLWLANGPVLRVFLPTVIASQAAKAGLKGSCQAEGSLLSGIALTDVDFKGAGPLREARADRIGVNVDLWKLATATREMGWLQKVEVIGPTIAFSPSPKDSDADREQAPDHPGRELGSPKKPLKDTLDRWWGLLDAHYTIQNLSVEILDEEKGQGWGVDYFSLELPPGGVGSLSAAAFHLPSGLGVEGLSASLRTTTDSFTLEGLNLSEAIRLRSLQIDRTRDNPIAIRLDVAGGKLSAETDGQQSVSLRLEEGVIDIGRLIATSQAAPPPFYGDVTGVDLTLTGFSKSPSEWQVAGVAQLERVRTSDRSLQLDATSLTITVAEGAAKAALEAQSGSGEVTLDVSTPMPEDLASGWRVSPADIQFSADIPDLLAFVPRLESTDIRGGIVAQCTLQGDGSPQLRGGNGTLSTKGLTFRGLAIESTTLGYTVPETDVVHTDVTVDLGEGTSVSARTEASLETKLYSGEASGTLDVGPRLAASLDGIGAPLGEGTRATFTWDGSGTLSSEGHRGSVGLKASDFRWGTSKAINATLDGGYTPGEISLTQFHLASGGFSASGDGSFVEQTMTLGSLVVAKEGRTLVRGKASLPFDPTTARDAASFLGQTDPWDVQLNVSTLPLAEVLALAGSAPLPVDATLDASVSLSGSPHIPDGTFKMAATRIRVPDRTDIPEANLTTKLALAPEQIALDARLDHPQIEPLTAEGTIAYRPGEWIAGQRPFLEEPVSIRIEMPPSDLSVLTNYTSAVEEIEGDAGISATIGGALKSPTIDGSLTASVGRLRFANPNAQAIQDLELELRSQGRTVSIERAEAVVAGGKIQLGGNVELPVGEGPRFNLEASAQEALIYRNEDLSIRTNADLTLAGPWEGASLNGSLGLTNSRFHKDVDLVPRLTTLLQPRRKKSRDPLVNDPSSLQTAKLKNSLRVGTDALPFADWKFGVRLTTADPFLIRGNLAQGEINADIRVTGTGADPIPDGVVRIDRADLTLPLSKAQVSRGEIRFSPATRFNGRLDLEATSSAGGYDVNVLTTGSIVSPKITLASTPPLPDEDIIALLATGSTLQNLGGGGGALAASKAALLLLRGSKKPGSDGDGEKKEGGLLDRASLDTGTANPETGRQLGGGRLRITENLEAYGGVDLEGQYRALLRYLFKFR